MSKVSCKYLDFNEDWDTKLKFLLEYGTPTLESEQRIRFKIHKGVRKILFFIIKENYDEYDVWVANKTSHYGHLDSFNSKRLPAELNYSASQETLDNLYELELKLKNEHFDYNRIYK